MGLKLSSVEREKIDLLFIVAIVPSKKFKVSIVEGERVL
jgi:hypothetical protein